VDGGSEEQPLIAGAEGESPLDWSPDGALILYATLGSETASDLWAVALAGDRKPFPVVQTRVDDVQGQFSPDGKWLAYGSNESGRYEVYVQAFPKAGAKLQVSTAGGLQPRWRRDGRELYYIDTNNRMMAVQILPSTDTRTVDVGPPLALFTTRPVTGANIFETGPLAKSKYDVAPDGRFLMIAPVDDAASPPINVILNWEQALGR
jgi:Tol biopolymer transport system component